MDTASENLMAEEYVVQVFNGSDHQLIGTVRGRNQVTILGEVEKLITKQEQVVEIKQREEVPL
jgi:hypothetical protein